MPVVSGADLVAPLAQHLPHHQHHDGDDEGVAGDDDDVEEPAGQAHVVGAQHVPRQHRPHGHVHRHPGEQ